MEILGFFSPDHMFFTGLGYRMSALEFFGTLLSLWSVWLAARNHILNWPVGNVAAILFAILFFQVQLYSDFVEQIYYVITGSLGWWLWRYGSRAANAPAGSGLGITHNSLRLNILCGGTIVMGTAVLGHLMANIHQHLPQLFTKPAAFPYLDAFTTMMSFAANLLMVHRKIECWYLWIAVDVLGVGLYYSRGILLVSLLYLIFLALATQGYWRWRDEEQGLQTEMPGLSTP
jgi:nicotinamide mononucleotide transporter